MRRLILDFGNTLQKIAVFDGWQLLKLSSHKDISAADLKVFIGENGPFEASILSSVIPIHSGIRSILNKLPHFMILDHETDIPISNLYGTPETLGKDRLAAVIGVARHFEGKDALVIDAGTAITFDLVTARKEYLGGAISPGIDIRFRALHKFTGSLPLVSRKNPEDLIGKSTEGSILSGVMNGAAAEVDGIIEQYRSRYPDIVVAITGGDAAYFAGKLKSDIFALPNLVLEGLNVILDWNV